MGILLWPDIPFGVIKLLQKRVVDVVVGQLRHPGGDFLPVVCPKLGDEPHNECFHRYTEEPAAQFHVKLRLKRQIMHVELYISGVFGFHLTPLLYYFVPKRTVLRKPSNGIETSRLACRARGLAGRVQVQVVDGRTAPVGDPEVVRRRVEIVRERLEAGMSAENLEIGDLPVIIHVVGAEGMPHDVRDEFVRVQPGLEGVLPEPGLNAPLGQGAPVAGEEEVVGVGKSRLRPV